ncbi:hypothetical protein KI387_020279, partial [Taxus chinensis]
SVTRNVEADDQSPIEEVALTVPTTDDPTLSVLTFRMWVLGIASCILLAFLNQFFFYRENPLQITAVPAQIAVLPLGHFMAATLPTKVLRFPGTNWRFSLNPGPFNYKEHVLITIFANAGASGVYAVNIVTIIKAFYKRQMNPVAGWLLSLTTQMIGFGWAGIFRKILVESAYMWWPANLVQVSIFRALHVKERRPKRGLSRLQFFVMALICSFSYYIIPNFLFPSVSAMSIACWIWKDSVTAQQIGSGLKGLGIGSFALDWAAVSSFLGSPLASPWFAIANTIVGFITIVYVVTPISYWTNIYNAKNFPLISSHVFTANGQPYNTTKVLASDFTFDRAGYNDYSQVNLSTFFAITYGLNFATLAATFSHVFLFYGKDIWQQTKATLKDFKIDVHTRIMKRNYKSVPQFWFHVLLVLMIGLSIVACEGFGKQLQLPWWGVLLACALAFSFTLPIGIILATTNQRPGLNVITEYIIGYLYPGRPLANVSFKTYGFISMVQALAFLQDFKLGHYMKIPPRSMFLAQLVGTLVAGSVYFGTAWWLLETVENICHPQLLAKGSPWTCPGDDVFYNASIIWGVVGPQRMFGNLGLYGKQNWWFLVGVLAPVPFWCLFKIFPNHLKWCFYVNMPLLLGATANMPPARSVNYICWGAVGFVFNYILFIRHKSWWSRNNYILSGALDAGVAFLAIVCYFTLQMNGVSSLDWWGGAADDHCALANCPTAPGIHIHGCPIP